MHHLATPFETFAAKALAVFVIQAKPHPETASESHPYLHFHKHIYGLTYGGIPGAAM